MKFEIKSWLNGGVLFSSECESLSACVVLAVKSRADLSRAYLSGADLSGAYLSRAYLSRAYLSGADLSGADLSGAYLSRANLSRADLSGAYLSRADLSGADLSGADLSGAYLSRANLTDIKDAALALARTRIVPQEGSFVGWKKLRNGVIAELVIPHDAERVNAAGSRKCRASKVHVWNMWNADGKEIANGIQVEGQHDHKTLYEVGKETLPDKFDPSITEECSHGIHFFLTREEAQAY